MLSSVDLEAVIKRDLLKLAHEATGMTEYLLPPLPEHHLHARTSCWIYGAFQKTRCFGLYASMKRG